jgi:hypothetical protein
MGTATGATQPKKANTWKKKGTLHLDNDMLLLTHILSNSHITPTYLIDGHVQCDTAYSQSKFQVAALLDTGAVQGDYCSKAVGDWVRQHCPDNWQAADEGGEVALAAAVLITKPLGSCCFDLILKKENNVDTYTISTLTATILDLGVDMIVERPTVREQRLVHVFPTYLCAPTMPSAPPLSLDASPAVVQTRDATGPLLDVTQQPL